MPPPQEGHKRLRFKRPREEGDVICNEPQDTASHTAEICNVHPSEPARAEHSGSDNSAMQTVPSKRVHQSTMDNYEDTRVKRPRGNEVKAPFPDKPLSPYTTNNGGLHRLRYNKTEEPTLFSQKENGISAGAFFFVNHAMKTCERIGPIEHNKSDTARYTRENSGTWGRSLHALIKENCIPYDAVKDMLGADGNPLHHLYVWGEICTKDTDGCDACPFSNHKVVYSHLMSGNTDKLIWVVYAGKYSDGTLLSAEAQAQLLQALMMFCYAEHRVNNITVVPHVLCTPYAGDWELKLKQHDKLGELLDKVLNQMGEGVIKYTEGRFTKYKVNRDCIADTRLAGIVKQTAGFILLVDRQFTIQGLNVYLQDGSKLVNVLHVPIGEEGTYPTEFKDDPRKITMYKRENCTDCFFMWIYQLQTALQQPSNTVRFQVLKSLHTSDATRKLALFEVSEELTIELPLPRNGQYICVDPKTAHGSLAGIFDDRLAVSFTQVCKDIRGEVFLDGASVLGPVRTRPPRSENVNAAYRVMNKTIRTAEEQLELNTGTACVSLSNPRVFDRIPEPIKYKDALDQANHKSSIQLTRVTTSYPWAINRRVHSTMALCRAQDLPPPKVRTSDKDGRPISIEKQTPRGIRYPKGMKFLALNVDTYGVKLCGNPFMRFLPGTDFNGTGCLGESMEDPGEKRIQEIIAPQLCWYLFESNALQIYDRYLDCIQDETGQWTSNPDFHLCNAKKIWWHWYNGIGVQCWPL